MTKLSVNINKLATLRNARGGNNPDLIKAAIDAQRFGAAILRALLHRDSISRILPRAGRAAARHRRALRAAGAPPGI